MIHKIYNLTGKDCLKSLTIISCDSNGKELVVWSDEIFGAVVGDYILIDRPHCKNIIYEITGIGRLWSDPNIIIAKLSYKSENIGGHQGDLKLRWRKSLDRRTRVSIE